MITKIYGCSDDLIEIDGAVNDEVDAYNKQSLKVSCSDGTILKVQYDGNWHFTVKETGPLFNRVVIINPAEDPHTDPDAKGCPGYSDVVILNPGIEWVKVRGKKFMADSRER